MRYIPNFIKIILSIGFPPFAIVWAIACSREMTKKLKNATQNPNEQTAEQLIESWTRIKLGVNNHPRNWKMLRDSWYRINGSNRVTTAQKQKIIDLFQKKGLIMNKVNIINNYNGRSS